MPNTVIALSLDDAGVTLRIAVPLSELRLAMREAWPQGQGSLDQAQQAAVRTYLSRHLAIRSPAGEQQEWAIQSITVSETTDPDAGRYQEILVRCFVRARPGFEPRRFTIAYDAVIHQIPNHFALVQITEDFRRGVLDPDGGSVIGVIRYDFARDLTPPLEIDAGTGSVWTGFRRVAALGFRHVVTGFDHLLFLATLLIVAPLRAAQGRWSLFHGWQYAARRFLAISLAFTLGHSIALLTGAYGLAHAARGLVEVLIAVSILVTALHAIRPMFPGRE